MPNGRKSRMASAAMLPSPIVPTTRSLGSRPSSRVLSAQRPCRTSRSFESRFERARG